MRVYSRLIYALLFASALVAVNCGGGPQITDPRDIAYPSSVEQKDSDAAIADAQAAYNALGEDGTAETGKAKEYLDKAKEFAGDKEYEAAWASAIKAKSFCALSHQLQQTRAAGLK
ncbi:MAG: hypothetical protein JSR44_03430 [Spirochaetes bacterium]|nr:hypothetical protein [Spirochaetota bacterium]